MNGVLVINKPEDFTSFDVVAVVRKYTGQKKIGHTGTLDPNATGVLPLLLGNATKAQDIIVNHDKEYVADFKLGLTTDTLDIWGEVKTQQESHIKREEIEKVLPSFTGEISQIPPMFSAVQINGQRLYDLARKGVEVERKSRKVTVYNLELLEFNQDTQQGKLKVACSKGTYIRTIIDDIGAVLGVGAVMTKLNRTMACGYSLDEAVTLEEMKDLCEKDKIKDKLIATESLFANYGYVAVSDLQAKRFYNGGALDVNRTYLEKINPPEKSIFRVKDKNHNFLGLGIVEGELLKIFKHF